MTLKVIDLGLKRYSEIYDAMRDFNEKRDAKTDDEIWLLEHPPVYTLGLAGKEEHLLNTHNIPVIKTDRGGQVTYHGPGQLIAYLLLDLNRRPYAIKKLVTLMEESIIQCLHDFSVDAERMTGAPGVYVSERKIAALGVRVKRGCTYHGLAINIDMDLMPFKGINPCGYENLICTQLVNHKKGITVEQVKTSLTKYLLKNLDQVSARFSDVA